MTADELQAIQERAAQAKDSTWWLWRDEAEYTDASLAFAHLMTPEVALTLLADREAREQHHGEPATNERIKQAHSAMKFSWLGVDTDTHFAYKQGHDEECYICTLLKRAEVAEQELARRQQRIEDATGEFTRPSEEDERRSLRWLVDERANGGPLEQRFAATAIDSLAFFEALLTAREQELARLDENGRALVADADRWCAAYAKARDDRAAVEQERTQLYEALTPFVAQVRKSVDEWTSGSTPMADLAAALEAFDEAVEESARVVLAEKAQPPKDATIGAGGYCGKHGLYDGLRCPKCAAEKAQPHNDGSLGGATAPVAEEGRNAE